jgi:NAD kinase
MLPKIVTVSMGSLNYLSNFSIQECTRILDATALNHDQSAISHNLKIDYRTRLQCMIGIKEQSGMTLSNRNFVNSDGTQEI